MAGAAAAGTDRAGAGDAAGSGAHPGEAQPVLTAAADAAASGGLTIADAPAARPATAETLPAAASPTDRLPADAAPAARRRLPLGGRTFSSLGTRNYRLFATGQVISNTGSWMQRVAQDWLVLNLTHGSGEALGITTGLQFLPLLLFSLWGGMIADRYSKRRILMVTQTVMGALALILGILAITGAVRIWHVYALAFGLGLATVVDNPTRQAFAVEMVGRADMPNAIALNSAVFNLARIAGPAIAGLVISVVGTPAAFLVNAASYLAVLVSLKLMRQSELLPADRVPRARGQLREGLSYVRARPSLWMPMILIFFVATFGMNFQVTNALMSREVFHTGAGDFGIASAIFAVGALGGALLAARRGRPTMPLLLVTSLAFGVLEILTGLMPTFWSFLVLLAPTGLAVLTFTTAANSATQLRTNAEMRGRVMGIYMLVFLGGAPLGSPLAGWIAQTSGPRMSMIAGGLISAVATVIIAMMLVHSRGVRARSYLRPARLARMVT
ncbi:MAG: MFS transporter [Streptosporangiaceae bacterium]